MMNKLYQIGNLKQFAAGNLDGFFQVSELHSYGDTGIGTFHAADGEMIILDGYVYHVPWDGQAYLALDEDQTPLVNLCTFQEDRSISIQKCENIRQLEERLSHQLDANSYYVLKGFVICDKLQVRSAYKQQRPYRPLAEFLQDDETTYKYENVRGWVVGIYCPKRVGEYNATGWHFHYLSENKSFGGHIKDIAICETNFPIMEFHDLSIIGKHHSLVQFHDATIRKTLL